MNDKNKRPVDLIGPVLLIGLGVIVLLNNVGLLDWSFWDVIRLWPVLLVAAGLQIVIGRHSLAGSLISALVVLGLILGVVWFSGTSDLPSRAATYESVAYPLGDTTSAVVNIETGVAEVRVESLSDSENLIEGEINPGRRANLSTSHDDGETAEVVLSSDGPTGGWVGSNSGGRWILALNELVEYDLTFDQGIGDLDLDLRDLMLDELSVDYGIGQIKVQIPAEGNYDLNLDGGIGEVIVEVPEGLGVQVYTDSGIVNRTMPPGWERSGDTWTDGDYHGADDKARININLGIGSIIVREVGE